MKKRKAEFLLRGPHEALPLRIVSDAAIATAAVGDGRLIPLFIVDTSERPDVEELVRIHSELQRPGDHTHQWGQIEGHPRTVALFLRFERPAELTAVLEFDLAKQAALVDQVMTAHGLYLQPGREGDRLRNTLNNPKILIDVSESGFARDWNKIYRKETIRSMRDGGMSRSESKLAADRLIEEWRKFTGMRIPGSGS